MADYTKEAKHQVHEVDLKDGVCLVTGASGYISTHIIQLLLQAGCRVRGTLRDLKDLQTVEELTAMCSGYKNKLELVQASTADKESVARAVSGCTYVFHVDSPLCPEDECKEDPAPLETTRGVLEACRDAGSVRRMVLTASILSAFEQSGVTESSAEKEAALPPKLSKILQFRRNELLLVKLAEEFAANLPEKQSFEVVIMNVAMPLGPVLTKKADCTVKLVLSLMNRKIPCLPKVSLPLVDVRDVAEAHVRAMYSPDAVGQRHVLSAGMFNFSEVCETLDAEFKSQGYKCSPCFYLPDWLVRLVTWCFTELRGMEATLAFLEKEDESTKQRSMLGVEPRPLQKTLLDCGYSLIAQGLVPRTQLFRGPSTRE